MPNCSTAVLDDSLVVLCGLLVILLPIAAAAVNGTLSVVVSLSEDLEGEDIALSVLVERAAEVGAAGLIAGCVEADACNESLREGL